MKHNSSEQAERTHTCTQNDVILTRDNKTTSSNDLIDTTLTKEQANTALLALGRLEAHGALADHQVLAQVLV